MDTPPHAEHDAEHDSQSDVEPDGDGPTTPSPAVTGERTVPDVPDENYWFQRHVAMYDHVAHRVSGTILDAGCGEGYGLAILHGAGARGVIGVDVDPVVADHARRRYGHDGIPDIDVVEADLYDLPLVADTLDGAVCLQVVEHLTDPSEALAELVRVVRPGGLLAVSTPNRTTFSPGDGGPTNPFHVREYDANELAHLVSASGVDVEEVLGLHHGARLARDLGVLVGSRPTAVLADASRWDDRLRALVHQVEPSDFHVAGPAVLPVQHGLDLVAWARVVS